MSKRFLRRYLPDHASLQKNRFLARFSHWFSHPNLWHLNRRSVAGGVAVGMIGGMIPGPLQVITASCLSLACRVNLPVAVVATFYTNPLTIGPIYWVAFKLGSFVTGHTGADGVGAMPSWSGATPMQWVSQMCHWMLSLGVPLLIGLPLLAGILAVVGYTLVKLAWRLHVLWLLRVRRLRRATPH
ncbi:hypothetical protein IGB42_03855 [Andreprevotia sp. IGB-42]|uniref:DUF2062 domain-containing protein n=1 Tax=Andreprevotia sp. IGB-42 TaxID=2497473 RepID=UPI001358C778|nr:DUF2062 domain-containing protein [Andreprevotia sp. IGB-42]KAF0811697.1 hypothetical protein IGB42_03855 [Andreprevotia sp. IGB-42]